MATKTLKLGFFSQIQRFFGSKRIRRIHKLALSPDHQNLEPYNPDGPLQRVLKQIQQSPRPLYLGFHEGQCKSEARPRARATRQAASSTTLCAAPRNSASSTTLCASKVQGTERSSNQRKLPRSRSSSSTVGAALKDTESSIALRTCSSTMRTVVTSLNAGNMKATRDQLMKKLRCKEQRQCVPLESAVSAIRINIGENAGRRSCRRIRVESSKSQMDLARRPSNTKLFCSNSQLSVKASQSRMYSVKPPPAKHCEKHLGGQPGVDVKLAVSWFGRMANKDINLDNCRPQQTARAPSPTRSASGSQYPLKKVPSSEKRAQNVTNRPPKHSRSLSIYSGKLMPMEVPIKKPISRDLQPTSRMSSKPNESPDLLYPWQNGEIDSVDWGKPIRMELSSSSYPSEMLEFQPQAPVSLQNEGKLDLKKPIKVECPLQILHQAPKIHRKPSSSSGPSMRKECQPATLEEVSLLSKRKVNFGTPIRMEPPVRFEKPSRMEGKTKDDEKKTLTMKLQPWKKPATLLHEILSSSAAKPKLLRKDPWPEAKKSQENVREPLARDPPCTDICKTERKSQRNVMQLLREIPNRTRISGEDRRLKHIRESVLIKNLIARIDKILACPARSQRTAATKNPIDSAELPAKANEKHNTKSAYLMTVRTFVNHSYLARKSLSRLLCPSVSRRPDLSLALSPFTEKDYTNSDNGAAEKLRNMSICELMKPFQILESMHETNTILQHVSRQSEWKVDLGKPFWRDYSIFEKPIQLQSPLELSLEESAWKEEEGAFDLAEFLKIESQLKALLAEFTKDDNDFDLAESFEIESLFPPGTFEYDFLRSPFTWNSGTSIPIPISSPFAMVFRTQMTTEALEQVLLQAEGKVVLGKPIKMANATPVPSIAELLCTNSFQNYIKGEFDLADDLEIEYKTPRMLAKIQSGTSFERVVPTEMVPAPLMIASEAPESDLADEEKTKTDLAELLETESKVQQTLDKFVKDNKENRIWDDFTGKCNPRF
ncbi:GL14857 [Drosophila persimilis]|uniref:GL14857 n=1 Tax=Drosophila persimilis TaxID=7234 RepID=B4H0H1_DROPE|nr:GL14857 [Drosophila persimilis]